MGYEKSRPASYSKIPFEYEVGLGKFPRYANRVASGFNPSAATGQEDIWLAGGQLVYLTSAEVMNITSSSASDTLGGIGAETLLVSGLDNDWVEQQEIVTLNGLTVVPTVNSYLRVISMGVLSAGTTENNEGIITATAAVAATIQCQAGEETNQSQQIHHSVPAGKVALYVGVSFGTGTGAQALFRFKLRLFGSVFRTFQSIESTAQATFYDLKSPQAIPEKSDIKMTAEIGGGNPPCSGSLYHIFIDEREAQF